MIEQDYELGDMIEWSKPSYTGGTTLQISVVVKRIDAPDLSSTSNWYPAYVVMEPGGRRATVSHRMMRRIK